MRLSFILASGIILAQESDLLVQNLQHVEQHKSRLAEDIAKLEEQRMIFADHPWLPRATDKNIELKQQNLQLLNSVDFTGDEPLLSMQSIRNLVPGSVAIDSSPARLPAMFSFRTEPPRSLKKYQHRPMEDLSRLRGELYLKSIGFQPEDIIEMDFKPYLSLTVDRAKFYSKMKSEDLTLIQATHITAILSTMGEDMLEETYHDPETPSVSWLRLMAKINPELPSEIEITMQIQKQLRLISEDDFLENADRRRLYWKIYKANLLRHYHHPHFRKILSTEKSALDAKATLGVKSLDEEKLAAYPSLRDLSHLFHEPRVQGETLACMAFAAAADWELHGTDRLSVSYLYNLGSLHSHLSGFPNDCKKQLEEKLERKESYLQAVVDAGLSIDSLAAAMREGIPCEADCPFNEKDWILNDLNSIPSRTHVAKLQQIAKETPSLRDIQFLIDRGIPTLAIIRFAARSIEEDWIRPEPLGGIGHALNIVGYGEAIDPFDLQRKDVLIVRDSLVPHAMHYRIAADELLPITEGLYKVTQPQLRDEPIVYKDGPVGF